ncbi:MAG: SDR family oxidoreductase [Rhodobacteraceae bacterium]|nr:SDR family oxidoreductase [Paracoccaceae bacterium]
MPVAFVTGGSSGIGLAVARKLAARGYDLALFARGDTRLGDAKGAIIAGNGSCRVEVFPVDVSDRAALQQAVAEAIGFFGVPEMAIASAGIAEPGLFMEQSAALHERHMAVNYFGAHHFVQALATPMAEAGRGKIGLIASGAAFFGIYGYSAYAPSKFALRALAEVLRVELAPHGLSVTLCYPPDTDTPQLEAEKRTKPYATQIITEGGGLWQPEDVAERLVQGMEQGKFTVAPGWQMKALLHFGSLLAPFLRWHQRRIVRKVNND